jgi:hypothetical protein
MRETRAREHFAETAMQGRTIWAFVLMLWLPVGSAGAADKPMRQINDLPALIDRLLTLQPVIPTTIQAVSRATAIDFPIDTASTPSSAHSGSLTLTGGTLIQDIELRMYGLPEHAVQMIHIVMPAGVCIDPYSLIERYHLHQYGVNPPPSNANIGGATGEATDARAAPAMYSLFNVKREAWGLFFVSYAANLDAAHRDACLRSITLRKADANEKDVWR